MTKTNFIFRSGLPLLRRATAFLRWAARRLELRSFALAPEQFNLAEGYRAAAAVAVPLILAVSTGNAKLGWAVFAAFWTCLCDAPGPDRLRRRNLAFFVICGAVVALTGSWLASLAPAAGMAAGPFLVVVCVIGAGRVAYGGPLGTLLAVVAVVAVGFPRPVDQAFMQALAFLLGSAWAYLLINALWRIDPLLPLSRGTGAVVLRLLDMAESLAALGERPHRDERWHSEHAEHRRSVRMAIERLRGLLARYAGEKGEIEPYERALKAGEAMFGAMIALDQTFIDRVGSSAERLAVMRAYKRALVSWNSALRSGSMDAIKRSMKRSQRLQESVTDDVFVGCAIVLRAALKDVSTPLEDAAVSQVKSARQPHRLPVLALRQALRQAAGLIAVYYAAEVFHLGYPYWAAMAVVVVLQGGARVTWTRCLERILGSLVGGTLALALFYTISNPLALSGIAIALAAVAIALRSVNYTVFVVFLTMLFVIVTEMLQPGVGIASARMLDNVVGSTAALLAVFLLWPDFGASVKQRVLQGIEANRAYFDTVQAGKPFMEIEAARRQAGISSVEAEAALHDLGGIMRRIWFVDVYTSDLRQMRNVAGQAAIAWHRHIAIREEKKVCEPGCVCLNEDRSCS